MKKVSALEMVLRFVFIFLSFYDSGIKDELGKSFVLKGEITGFTQNELLIIEYPEHKRTSDTIHVINNSFVFKGYYPVDETVIKVILRTPDYSDYIYFFIDGDEVYFKGERGNFKTAIVEGSMAEDEYKKYQLKVSKKYDQITTLNIAIKHSSEVDIAKIMDTINEIEKEIIHGITSDFIADNPNSHVSLDLLHTYCKTMGKLKTSFLFNKFPKKLREHGKGKEISRFIALNKELKIGDYFVDVMQQNTEGKMVKLSDFKGKYVLLEFWSSYCGPCRRENPDLVKLYDSFKDKGFEIFAVSADESKSMWLKAIEKDKLPWVNVSELNGAKNSAVLTYGVFEYPTNYLINSEGIIIAKNLRGTILKSKLEEIFKNR